MGQSKEDTVPASQVEQTALKDQKYVWHHLIQHKPFEEAPPMMVVSGEGMRIKTDTGQEYLDAVCGYAAISCTVTSEAIFNEFKKNPDDPMSFFRDISTYGGCTAGPAAAIENMKIIKEENLLNSVIAMGDYAMESLNELKERHSIIGDVRGKGLFLGIELVKDRKSKEPVHESITAAVGEDCMQQGVIIGRTNRSFAELNNTLCLAPALIATKDDIDEIVTAIDNALSNVN